MLNKETFERGFAVDQCGDDFTGARFAWREKHHVPVDDVRACHRVSAHSEREERCSWTHAQSHEIDANKRICLRNRIDRKTGGDGAEQRNARRRRSEAAGWSEAARFARQAFKQALFLERLKVASDGERAGETEVGLDLAKRGKHTVFSLVREDVFEDLLLAIGGHSVQMNTISAQGNRKLNYILNLAETMVLRMRHDRDDRDHWNPFLVHPLIRSVVPKNAVGSRSFILRVCLEYFFAIFATKRRKFVCMQAGVLRIRF